MKVVKDTLKNEFENLILPPPPAYLGGDIHNHVNPNIRHWVNNFAKPGNQETGEPTIQGGEDEDVVSRQRRNHVKGVSSMCTLTLAFRNVAGK